MPRFQFNKLVRDRLPDIYEELGQRITWRRLIGRELLKRLRDKLVEEAAEIPIESEDRETIIDELADVEQVTDDIKERLDISDEEVKLAKEKKFAKKGGFSEGIFVEVIELDDGDEWVEYYRREPKKYKEVE
jgi:predicted house-cleaning noncanonical NTP pyrophosphatase (MazG superfamily)